MNTSATQSSSEELIIGLIFTGLLILIIFLLTMRKRNLKKARKQAITNNAAYLFGRFQHTAGLPIAADLFCNLSYSPKALKISAGGMQFNLNLDKVTDITTTTNVDIQKNYVSSAGGAIGGAMLFGPVGALIGGRTKEKIIRDVHTFLIITYLKDNAVDYIAFNVTGATSQAYKFVNEYKMHPQIKQTVNL